MVSFAIYVVLKYSIGYVATVATGRFALRPVFTQLVFFYGLTVIRVMYYLYLFGCFGGFVPWVRECGNFIDIFGGCPVTFVAVGGLISIGFTTDDFALRRVASVGLVAWGVPGVYQCPCAAVLE